MPDYDLDIRHDVAQALRDNHPVVALETTLIAHGLPWPVNLECATQLETTIATAGAVAATIGIVDGRVKIGLSQTELERFARAAVTGHTVNKVSRRDLAWLLASGGDGATTVAATMLCAHRAGIRVFATGGIGGVHRAPTPHGAHHFDISADLTELAQTSVAVVCAGAKSILDLPRTLEVLETYGVPVIGYGSAEFPAFYSRHTQPKLHLTQRADTPQQVAKVLAVRDQLRLGGGEVIAVPIPAQQALDPAEVEHWIERALGDAEREGVSGKTTTPFLLARIAELSDGRTLQANLALVNNNAQVAAEIACAWAMI